VRKVLERTPPVAAGPTFRAMMIGVGAGRVSGSAKKGCAPAGGLGIYIADHH